MTHKAPLARHTGYLLARILRGTWRRVPPPLDLSPHELAHATPALLACGAGQLGWWRIRDSALQNTPAGMQLHDAFRMQVLSTAMQRAQLAEVFGFLRVAGIEPVLIKGWAVARLYPQEGLRPWTDIDLCIDPAQMAAATALLEGPHGKHYEVDLVHTEVTDPRGLLARSQLVMLGDVPIRIPCPEDHLRLLCIHALKHDIFRPQWLCDIAAAVERRPADFSWPLLLDDNPCHAGWITCAIGLAHHLLGADIAGTPLESAAETMPRWLLPSVIKVWDDPYAYRMVPEEGFVEVLRHPGKIPAALRERWPKPLHASIMMDAPFNAVPRLPIQIALYGLRAVRQLLGLRRALRITEH